MSKCKACLGDASRAHEKRRVAWDTRVERVNAWRESKGREPLYFWSGAPRWWGRVPEDDAEACARVFGGKTMWWDKPVGYVADEVKRALRRPPAPAKAKRDKWGQYKPLDYTLPMPTLAASSKRLANANLDRGTWTGPKAAEQYIAHRRAELGLTLSLADLPEMEVAA